MRAQFTTAFCTAAVRHIRLVHELFVLVLLCSNDALVYLHDFASSCKPLCLVLL
jgi:hypothetical protein